MDQGPVLCNRNGSTRYTIETAHKLRSMWGQGEIKLWEGNREVDLARAKRIAQALELDSTGVTPIVVAEFERRLLVIDGQHRLHAFIHLEQKRANEVEVLVCKTFCSSEQEVRRLFRVTNSGTPVPLSFFNEEVKAFAEEVADRLNVAHPGVITAKGKAQRPRITRRDFIERISSSTHTRDGAAAGRLRAEEAEKEVQTMNRAAKRRFGADPDREAANYGATAILLARAKSLEFYLGLDGSWVDTLMNRLAENWQAADDEVDEVEEAAAKPKRNIKQNAASCAKWS
jgi:hypothetical protein